MSDSLRERLRRRDKLVGSFVTIANPVVGEVMAHAGFDFLIVDVEHTGMSLLDVQTVLQGASSSPTSCLVRIGELSAMQTKQALDSGASGIVIPHVCTKAQAEQAVRFAKYGPAGSRGVTAARAARYGLGWDDYSRSANVLTAVVPIIEDAEGVRNTGEIATVEGVDLVITGPWDLAASLGHFGELEHPDVEAAITSVINGVHEAGKPVGVYADTAATGHSWRDRGADVIILGEDYVLLLDRAREQLALLAS